ncbi:hypothetical protein F7725_004882, partial [Dissostichus mawsoni]
KHSCSLKSPSVSPPQKHSCSLKSPSVSPPQKHSCSLKSPSVSPPQKHSCSLKSPSVSPPQEHSCSLKSPSVSPPQKHSCSLKSPSVSPPQEHSCSLKSPSVSPQEKHSCSLKSPSVSPPQKHSYSLKSPSVSPPQKHSCSLKSPSVSPKRNIAAKHSYSLKSPSVSPPQKHSCSLKSPSVSPQENIAAFKESLFVSSTGTFVVNVTQASYQAEENQNITLEWTFSTRRDTSLSSISIVCDLVSFRPYNLLHLYKGIELPESQDPEFAGRVQWDKDVLTEGRLTLHVSRLRTNDSGLYLCKVFTDYGRNNGRCCLNVTAAKELEPQRPPESPQPESWRRLWLIVGLSAALLVLFVVSMACIVLIRYKRRIYNAAMQMESSSEEQTIMTV